MDSTFRVKQAQMDGLGSLSLSHVGGGDCKAATGRPGKSMLLARGAPAQD
jgi:hypothetical protein